MASSVIVRLCGRPAGAAQVSHQVGSVLLCGSSAVVTEWATAGASALPHPVAGGCVWGVLVGCALPTW